MVTPDKAAFYERCTVKELRSFIKARTGQAPGWKDRKNALVKALKQLDQTASFHHFLELSPELRNLVYENLLCHNKEASSIAYPAVLRTCKQIHGEAVSILNADSTAYIRVKVGGCHLPNGTRERKAKLSGDISSLIRDPNTFDRAFATLLQNLKSVRAIHIEIQPFEVLCWEREGYPNHSANSICCFHEDLVRVCQGLRYLKITFDLSGPYKELLITRPRKLDRYIVRSLKPLFWLSEDTTLDIQGLNEAAHEKLWTNIRSGNQKLAAVKKVAEVTEQMDDRGGGHAEGQIASMLDAARPGLGDQQGVDLYWSVWLRKSAPGRLIGGSFGTHP